MRPGQRHHVCVPEPRTLYWRYNSKRRLQYYNYSSDTTQHNKTDSACIVKVMAAAAAARTMSLPISCRPPPLVCATVPSLARNTNGSRRQQQRAQCTHGALSRPLFVG